MLSIAPLQGGGVRNSDLMSRIKELNSGKPNQKHVLDFTTQLAVMIRAGINLRSSLEGIAEQTEHAQFKKVIVALKTDVESGKQFSDAIARHPKLFGPLYVNMVRRVRDVRLVQRDAGPDRLVHRPADRDAQDGDRRVDLPGRHPARSPSRSRSSS